MEGTVHTNLVTMCMLSVVISKYLTPLPHDLFSIVPIFVRVPEKPVLLMNLKQDIDFKRTWPMTVSSHLKSKVDFQCLSWLFWKTDYWRVSTVPVGPSLRPVHLFVVHYRRHRVMGLIQSPTIWGPRVSFEYWSILWLHLSGTVCSRVQVLTSVTSRSTSRGFHSTLHFHWSLTRYLSM